MRTRSFLTCWPSGGASATWPRPSSIRFMDWCLSLIARLLTDEGDIRVIGRRLKLAARQAEDLLLVYFAGHGLVGGRRHDLYLGLPDSQVA